MSPDADVTHGRPGKFWAAMRGETPQPPAARTLGLEFVDADPEAGVIELAFTATTDFTNPMGNVLGAFLAAMLYDTLGPALLATLSPDEFQSTLDMNVNFLHPTRPGRLLGRGHVTHRDGDIARLEATLTTPEGTVIATATATARVIPLGVEAV
ncbi:PaaI family thioesterase [Nocardia macrotermitis]|uniref:Thioesterase domain-containing protein n=1 Tax=Nocardia macrotermitis TaxID=2585198 RepID=A0A7K0D3S3_9NOCA|nr:PaaI family thioesterase [Nocardia macrotermitis]MQY20368.1 hypothetical protein [Nocardia macrotermitis]